MAIVKAEHDLRWRILSAIEKHGAERVADAADVHVQTLANALLGRSILSSVRTTIVDALTSLAGEPDAE